MCACFSAFLSSFRFCSALKSSVMSLFIFSFFSFFSIARVRPCSFLSIGMCNSTFLPLSRSMHFAVMTAAHIPSGSVSCIRATLSFFVIPFRKLSTFSIIFLVFILSRFVLARE